MNDFMIDVSKRISIMIDADLFGKENCFQVFCITIYFQKKKKSKKMVNAIYTNVGNETTFSLLMVFFVKKEALHEFTFTLGEMKGLFL